MMDLIPDPPGRIIDGEIYIDGFNILSDLKTLAKIRVRTETDVKIKRNKRAIKRHNFILSKIRGNKISMIFQEPFLALNPTISIGKQ
ncbi:oligopeptide/dipeptide ABC transporter, ATPase subunit, partial [mine drainage metagenome]